MPDELFPSLLDDLSGPGSAGRPRTPPRRHRRTRDAGPTGDWSEGDPELDIVRAHLLDADPTGARVGRVLRRTYDQLYDGQRTGRWCWDDLFKTEKTHMGTLVEINLHREFKFDDGEDMDYRIAGVEVDCKFSAGQFRWMIPHEAIGHLCLVVWADDKKRSWRAGLVRITQDKLPQTKGNQDGKRSLTEEARSTIVPVWIGDGTLPENLLLHLDPHTRHSILNAVAATKSSSRGQAKVTELFRQVQGRVIDRNVVATLAMQDDYMKRVRYDGGARNKLQDAGILILGHQKSHQYIARAFGLPVPRIGEFVAVRVTPAILTDKGTASINGTLWRKAEPDDPAVSAPKLGKRKADDPDDETS